jgi:hypothetical protein
MAQGAKTQSPCPTPIHKRVAAITIFASEQRGSTAREWFLGLLADLLVLAQRRYVGDFKNAMRHGQGSFTWANGDVYEGDWKEDVCDGRGVLITANGDKYEGEFKMGVKEGQGRKVWTNGDVYEGSWRGGQQDGHGTFLMGDGCVCCLMLVSRGSRCMDHVTACMHAHS